MSQIDDAFRDALIAHLGHEGALPDLMAEFLQEQTGSSSVNVNDLWREFQTLIGTSKKSFNDRMMAYFAAQGLEEQYNDNFLQALIDGLLVFSAIQLEDGNLLLQEDGSSFILQE